jgi:hypothetical protein
MSRYTPLRVIVALLLLAALALVASPPARAADTSIRLTMQPGTLLADGQSTATVTADVRDSSGSRVPDGTPVRFTATAGTIDAVILTTAGIARAKFTSANIPDTAKISAFVRDASATVSLPMVTELPDLKAGSKIVRLSGKYVAYSENLRVLEATDEARVTFRGLEVTAQRLQVDLNLDVLRAHGTVQIKPIKGKGRELTGERLFLNLRTVQGYIVGLEEKHSFQGPELRESATPFKPAPDMLDLVDLSDSDMLWTAKSALAFLGDRVQLHGATAYWVGARLLPIGNHEIPLDGSAVGTDRYLGVGSGGLVLDLPYFLSLGAGGSTALRLRHNDRTGFGYFGQSPGWQLDLERKYGQPGSAEGLLTLDRMTAGDWGMRWNHSQPLGSSARVYTFWDWAAHRDLYGQVNLNKQWSFGSTTLSLSGNKLHDQAIGHSVDLGAESRAWALGSGFRLSLEGRVQDSRGGEIVTINDHRFQVPGVNQQQIGLRLRPPMLRLGPSSTLTSSLTARQAWGTRAGPGLVGALSFTQKLGGNNSLTLNYNYNQVPGYSYLQNNGKQNLTGTLFWRSGSRFKLTAFGMMGLDSPARNLTGSLSYTLTPSWRLDLQHTLYNFAFYSDNDTQIGIARALGPRELFLYWSTQRHRIAIEVGVNNF